MWLKLLNLIFVQLFVLQSMAIAGPHKPLPAEVLSDTVTTLKQLTPELQKQLYLSIVPLVHKDDMNLVEDIEFFKETIKNLEVKGDKVILRLRGEEAVISDINFHTLTASFNGHKFDLRKSVQENLASFEEKQTTSLFDLIFPKAHAQSEAVKKAPSKLKVIAVLAGGAVVAILGIGGAAYGWLKKGEGEEVVNEVQAPQVEELFQNDCKESKEQVKKSRLGQIPQITQEFVQRVKDKIQMLDKTQAEAKKMNLPNEQVQWINDSKNCYGEVIELVEKKNPAVTDDSNRTVKEIPQKSKSVKPQQKKASKQ